jgi:hypothetical protein
MKYLKPKFSVPASGPGNDKAMDWDKIFNKRESDLEIVASLQRIKSSAKGQHEVGLPRSAVL